jgi:hypothetical protein
MKDKAMKTPTLLLLVSVSGCGGAPESTEAFPLDEMSDASPDVVAETASPDASPDVGNDAEVLDASPGCVIAPTSCTPGCRGNVYVRRFGYNG